MADKMIEGAVRRDRIVVLAALSAVMLVSWMYILAGAGMTVTAAEMTATIARGGMARMMPAVWDFGYATLMFFMWWIMMMAMMLPSATPMILLFAAVNRRQREKGNPHVATTLFASAYLLAWAGFSLVAVALQWGLEALALLSPMLVSVSAGLGGTLLLAAGLYQFTPIKHACLKNCRSPLQFLMTRWRPGARGGFRMGLEHGAYCVGCCWFLMGLLFFGGIMNLVWIIGLAAVVLIEKTVPIGRGPGNVLGATLVAVGAAVLAGAI